VLLGSHPPESGDEMVAAINKVGVDSAIFISAFSMTIARLTWLTKSFQQRARLSLHRAGEPDTRTDDEE
jgi:hypothetical protein